jgi:PAS domain S-box-containing protein
MHVKSPQEIAEFWSSSEFARMLLDRSLDGILAFDQDLRYTFWNRAMERISGLPRERVLGKRATELLAFLEETGEEQFLRDALAGKSTMSVERPFRIPESGRRGLFEASYTPVRDVRGAVIGGIGVIRDISERRLAEERLRETEARFRIMADCAPVMLWMAGTDAKCDFFNKGWLDFTGRPLEQEVGDGWAEGVHPVDFQGCIDTYMEAFAARQSFRMEYRLRRHDGDFRWVLDQGTPRYSPHGEFAGYIGSCVDVTDFKAAAALLQKSNEELEERVEQRTSQLQEAVTQLEAFSHSVAHDIRTPIRALSGYSQVLLDEHARQLDENGRDAARRISRAARQIEALVRDLLAYSKLSQGEIQLEKIELEELARETLELMKADISERGGEVRVESALPAVQAHRLTLGQVMMNLLSNALKFVAPTVRPRVVIAALVADDKVRMLFQDNGIGIAPEYHQKIFRIFERLHLAKEYPGTGIGLAIVKRAMERMGGRVGVDSEPGRGSLFWIELPKA